MDTTAAAELAAGMAMAGDTVVLWEGGVGESRVGWSDEDYEADDSDWSSKNRKYSHHRHPRPPEKRARAASGDCSPASFSARGDSSGDPALLPTSVHDAQASDMTEFQGSSRAANGGGLLQKQNSARGSNSFSGELSEMGSALIDSSLANGSMGKSKGTGSIFFKTKLCCKFRAGTCPYNSNCNFAHGMEELRKPPPGWEEMVAAQEAERASRGSTTNQIQVVAEPNGAVNQGDSQRFHKTPRPCRKFYTEDGCPYGDRCIFMHDDQVSQGRILRESNAISLGPMTSQGNGGMSAGGPSERSSTWKSRVCNKWETTGHCPFGQKCHFVHGSSEGSASVLASRHGGNHVPQSQAQRQGPKAQLKWKGPTDEISTIYGDWIEEDEWDSIMAG
ncbi:hypothetical protein GOP47_0019223 [Adiantum capillus-veneris]|uniref:C3H1-type domain-containing protein n=1 Tax=Adiantum capillus-veneris TaxID=13818 RepID=A0A9D4UFV6_ADICA|nr:hypothetical protein GOP47_0019223 [Adiantum capillus-veneris]